MTSASEYKGYTILYVKATGLYVISNEPLGPSVRVAFSSAQARRVIDGMVKAKKASVRPQR